MSETQRTPEPWESKHDHRGYRIIIYGIGQPGPHISGAVAVCQYGNQGGTLPQPVDEELYRRRMICEANVRLMISSPRLLSLCESLVAIEDGMIRNKRPAPCRGSALADFRALATSARAVIAKAVPND